MFQRRTRVASGRMQRRGIPKRNREIRRHGVKNLRQNRGRGGVIQIDAFHNRGFRGHRKEQK